MGVEGQSHPCFILYKSCFLPIRMYRFNMTPAEINASSALLWDALNVIERNHQNLYLAVDDLVPEEKDL